MIDWVGGIENRNYGIKRITDPQKLSELLGIILSLATIAGVLLVYAWIRSQIIDIGYSGQQLRAQEECLVREQRKLVLEEQTLKNPERVETLARVELGMTRLRANQLLTPQFQNLETIGTTALALTSVPESTPETKKIPVTD